MSAAKPPLRGPGSNVTSVRGFQTFTAFGIIGFANTLLPYIIFSSLYLIIPFPPPVVLLIELLPALASKFLLSHTLHHIRHWAWPVLLVGCWTLVAIATNVAPPNVMAPIRVLIAVLASACTAAAEVFFLSRLSNHGKAALAGWGTGTAAAGALRSILPTVLTVHMGLALRNSTGYVYHLLFLILAAYFLVLPPIPCHKSDGLATERGLESEIESQKLSLVPVESPSPVISCWERLDHNLQLTSSKLLRLYINPILLIAAAQALLLTGTSRTSGMLPTFSRYSTFSAAYNLAFRLGNLIARSTALLFRARRQRFLFALFVFCFTAVILNAALLLIPNAYFVFSVVGASGWLSGMMYMNILSAAMEYLSRNPDTDSEFALGSISIGETAGILIGSLAGVTCESQLCGLANRRGRWCSTIT